MNSVFVALIFNFCAGIAPTGELQLGYQSEGECIVQLETTDPEGGVNPHTQEIFGVSINGHTLAWHWLDGGAEVGIDDQRFVIMEFRIA